MRLGLLAAAISGFVFLLACGDRAPAGLRPAGLAACGSAPMLTRPPIADADNPEIAPLGNLNPTGHVFPTDHVYMAVAQSEGVPRSVPVVAPGDVVISVVTRTSYGGTRSYPEDYGLAFASCNDVVFVFAHVRALDPSLAARVGAFGGDCQTYSTGNDHVEQCRKAVEIGVHAGDPLGAAGGSGVFSLDFGAYDRRHPVSFVDPARSSGIDQRYTVCPLDYFDAASRTSMTAKLGRRGKKRTVEPRCGTIAQDVPGTAQGRWFHGPALQDDPHLALVHDNVDPSLGVFSVGTSIPSLPAGTYAFAPTSAGSFNRNFDGLTADGVVYCYDTDVPARRRIVVQLVSATRLRIEGGPADSRCGDPSTWQLSSGAVQFTR